jgi:hypothetical protein
MDDLHGNPLDEEVPFCPHCFAPLGEDVAQQCPDCREYISRPRVMNVEEHASMDRRGCPSCAKGIPVEADICRECGEPVDTDATAAPSLPEQHQMYFDFQTFEDSFLKLPLPATESKPTVEDVVGRLDLGGVDVEIISDSPSHPQGPEGRTEWEIEFMATMTGKEAREAWVADDYGTGYTRGDRFHLWLERTPASASDFDLMPEAVTDEIRAAVETSNWTLGMMGHCSTEPAEDFRFQLTVARFAAGDDFPTIDETAARLLTADTLRDYIQHREKLTHTYATWTVRGQESTWVHTTGLPRIGALEIELLDVGGRDEVERARQLCANLGEQFAQSEKPPPFAVHNGDFGRYLWVPLEEARQFYPDGIAGLTEPDRTRLLHPSAVVFSESIDPETFERAAAHFGADGESSEEPELRQKVEDGPELRQKKTDTSDAGDWQTPGDAPRNTDIDHHDGNLPETDAPPPAIAALASFLFPGIGQLVCTQTAKGVTLLIMGLLSCNCFGLLSILSAIDAFLIAQKLHDGQPVDDWEFF